MTTDAILRSLMMRDIQMAADTLQPVYQRTDSDDGYVSVEVTPSKARDTQATLEEVRELWTRAGRKNLMVKIPATKEGLPAIEQSISEGMNINVTLIFSVERYREVAEAYIRGLERRAASGEPVTHIASVASIFVSRIDTLVDGLLEKKSASAKINLLWHDSKHFRGKRLSQIQKWCIRPFWRYFGNPGSCLKTVGASVQRPLWASTGTKNPVYHDLLYVDTLIGPHTVNTVPPVTYAAILSHSRPAHTVESDLAGARTVLRDLAAAGIDMTAAIERLEDDGVAAFAKSFDEVRKNLETKGWALAVGEVR